MPTLFDLPPEQRFIDPLFGLYRDEIGWQLTQFLYGEQRDNPLWDEPERWAGSAYAKFAYRTVDFDDSTNLVSAGGTGNAPIDMGGGQNVVVLGLNATVKPSASPTTPEGESLYNERASYVLYRQQRSDGTEEVPETPLANLMGSGQWPATMLFPWCWYGTSKRTMYLTNNGDADYDVLFAFQTVSLDTGR